jgi:predicted GIY-YIG superfamily endonuclease
MMWVYLLQSQLYPAQRYIGQTVDLYRRLEAHNAGECTSSSPYRPWRIIVAILFEADRRAIEFEKYLKSGSGRAFANSRLW